jgi:Helicase HerA, central domain
MSYIKRKDGFKDWQLKQQNKDKKYENYKKNKENNQTSGVDGLIWWLLNAPVKSVIFTYKIVKKLLRKNDNRIILGVDRQKTEWHMYPKEFLQHMAISGGTGKGKSYFTIFLIQQFLRLNIRVFFVDPHGKTIEALQKRVTTLDNLVFYRPIIKTNDDVWQVTGLNILFKTGSPLSLDKHVSDLMRCMFTDELKEGINVAPQAKFIIESAVYFTNNYRFYLASKGLDNDIIKQYCINKQITINDLATLQDNTKLYELFAEVLAFDGLGTEYDKHDLAQKWQEIIAGNKPTGFDNAVTRFVRLTQLEESKQFLEGKGFDVLKSIMANKSVFCDLQCIDEFTMGTITSLVFDSVYTLHKDEKIQSQTMMFIDESKMVKLPSLDQIIEQARKFNLGLVLMYQYFDQFNDNINARNAIQKTIVNKIRFGNEDDKDKQNSKVEGFKTGQLLFKRDNIEVELKVPQVSKELREYKNPIMSETSTVIRQRIKDKKLNIYKYFTHYEQNTTKS